MLQLQLIHLLYLGIILAPGVISGAIVTWKTRSPWSLFSTIGYSLLGSLIIAISTMLLGKLVAPYLSPWLGSWTTLIDFSQTPTNSQFSWWYGYFHYYLLSYLRYSLVAPIGTVTGATLAGMLLIVRYRLLREGGKFEPYYAWTSGFGSAVVGGVLGVFSILLLSWLGLKGLELASGLFRSTGGCFTNFAQITWGISILINGLVCGLISAVCGIKFARFLI
jgi:hypothetical protein